MASHATTSSQNPSPRRPDPVQLMQLSWSFANTRILQAAIDLNLFTTIDNGHKTTTEIAKACAASERGMRMLLNALTGLKMLEKNSDHYTVSDVARTFLSKNSPNYLGGWVGHIEQLTEPWEQLAEVVRSGQPARKVETEEHGGEFFAKFVDALYVMNKPGAEAIADRVVGERRGLRILDIGAGSGVWGISFARRDPKARVTIADFPKVIEVAKRFVATNDMTERFDYIPGNFQETEFGEGKYDVAILGHICHSEGERRTKLLFEKIKRALKPDGQIVIGEFLVDAERKENVFGLIFAINMLVNTQEGDTFSFSELQNWLRDAGFQHVDSVEGPTPSPLIVGRLAGSKAEQNVA